VSSPATTLGSAILSACERFADRPAMMVPPDFKELSYREMRAKIAGYAGTLRDLGLQRGDRLAICAENAPEWTLVDFAAQCLGIVTVPIFPTLPADQVQYILTNSGAKYALAGSEDLAKKLGELPCQLLSQFPAGQIAEADLQREATTGDRESLVTIIYTSGTTGVPKGVMLPARVFLHEAEAVPRVTAIGPTDIFYSFLPISHVYERIPGQYLPLLTGGTVAYSRGLAAMASDFTKVRPTIILCVPRFLESFRDRILDGVKKLPPLRQRLFAMALTTGVKRAQGGFAPLQPLLDRLVMEKIRARMGGRVRYLVSGGAALSPAVAEFYLAVGVTVLQGYGLTETGGGTVINRPENNKYWTVGEPIEVEVKIADDGEILIRGELNMQGYWQMPEETAAALDPQGWFHTGDIGEFEGKSLKITDRKKDLLVLGNGKNIAPQPIENKLRQSDYITDGVLLGDGMDSCAALIVPNAERVREKLSLPETEDLSKSDTVRRLLKSEIDAINRTLAPFEAVKRFAVLRDPFSVATGELTPSLKVKRKFVREKYADIIKTLY